MAKAKAKTVAVKALEPDEIVTLRLRNVNDLVMSKRNARKHSKEQVREIMASMREFGFTIPILVDEVDEIIAGHGRIMASRELYSQGVVIKGLDGVDLPNDTVPTLVAVGWTEDQKRAYRITDNKLTLNGEWDLSLLNIELADLKETGFDLSLTGFNITELQELKVTGDADLVGDPNDGEEDRGKLLSLIDITIADPKVPVELGDHFILSGRHHLLCVGVMKDWHLWNVLLSEGSIFCPYPGPFTPFGDIPKKHPLVMVQPDPYITGHILDHWIAVHGEAAVERITVDG